MLELGQSLMKNGVQATCSARNFQGEQGLANQEWFLQPEDNGWYTILNSGSRTVLEIVDGSSKNRTAVQGWARDPEKIQQLWRLDRRSRTSNEIANILGNSPPFNASGVTLENILADVGREWRPIEYVTILEGFRTEILLDSGWMNQGLAPRGQHDYLDFVKGTQNAVQTKAGERIGVPVSDAPHTSIPEALVVTDFQGVKVLFGIVEGETKGEKRAYNWTFTQDLCSVIFLDPQTGREYTTQWTELEGFSPTSVHC
ncbi:hypothetical protein FS837_000067 [Tulasnella sp. UAMH 9824]|nr:hypothetical protein FS837_000067 [Tulasnella sp. UAMH 9824]